MHKTERTLKEKGARKAKMYEKFSRKIEVLAGTHVRSLKLKGHLSGSCQNSHKAEYTARSLRNKARTMSGEEDLK